MGSMSFRSGCRVWVFKDKSYALSKCTAHVVGDDLHVKLSGYRCKGLKQVIKGFRSLTALEALREHGIASESYWGRHYEDCVFQVYHDLGLDLGYVVNPLRGINA